jgi:hypothetical protein
MILDKLLCALNQFVYLFSFLSHRFIEFLGFIVYQITISTAMYCQTCLFLLAKTSWPLQLFLLAFKFLVKSFYLIGVFFFIMIHSCFIFDAHLECTEWSSTIILNQMFSNFFLHVFSSFIHCQYLHILRKQLCPLNS